MLQLKMKRVVHLGQIAKGVFYSQEKLCGAAFRFSYDSLNFSNVSEQIADFQPGSAPQLL